MRRTLLLLASLALALLFASGVAPMASEERAQAASTQDQGRVAFISDNDGQGDWDIYTMNPDGSGVLHIERPGDQFWPSISPDGSKIAYFRADSGIYVANSDGGGQDIRILDDSGTVHFGGRPAWSPDGTQLAVSGYRPVCQPPCDNWRYEIYVTNSDGTGEQKNLTNTKDTGEGDPSWSTTGKIAFQSNYPSGSGEYYNNQTSDIYTMNPDGTGRTNLTNTANASEHFPSYSPNGAKVAYQATFAGEIDRKNFTMNADGSAQTRLTDTQGAEDPPSWSPDGSQIAFSAYRDAEAGANHDIFKVTAEGAGEANLTSALRYTNAPSSPSSELHPSWGPSPFSYDFRGFFSPVDDLPTLNAIKAGGAVPVRFGLGGDQGLDIFAEGYPKSQRIDCDSTAPIDPIEQTVSAGASSLSYDATTDRYAYVWKTEKAWSGSCRQFTMKLDDGTFHAANFKFK